jgi:hypothetical protein
MQASLYHIFGDINFVYTDFLSSFYTVWEDWKNTGKYVDFFKKIKTPDPDPWGFGSETLLSP